MTTLTGTTKVAGVIGYPISHSLSPRLHGYWLHRYGIDGVYIPMPVRGNSFASAVAATPTLGMVGFNVTLPHKEAALTVVDTASEDARRIGAVNTVVISADGILHGVNTDGFGFLENLRAGVDDWRPDRGPAVVIGAGGAARAICVALLDGGASEIRLVNRTRSRAVALASDLGGNIETVPWELRSRCLANAALVVNATTLGMAGNPPLDLDLGRLPREAVVTDIVYNPLHTSLLVGAAERGNRVVDGLGMLLHQARPGFAAWFGIEPEVTPELRAFVAAGMAR